MKRSVSPEKSDSEDKKSKLSDDNNATVESGSSSLASADGNNVQSDRGGDHKEGITQLQGPSRSEVQDTSETHKDSIPRSSGTPISIADDGGMDVEKTSDHPATETVEDKQDTGNEKDGGTVETENPDVDKWERWQLVPTTVRQRMNFLLTTSKLSDCSVLVGQAEQKEFKLHSVILCMSSPEFEDLLAENKDIVIPDVEPDIFKQILEYIYLDYMNLWSVEKTQALYRASVRFKLTHLCEKAVEYMMANMSLDSIWPIFDAALSTRDQILMEECNKFFKKNIGDLLKHPKFPTVEQSVIAHIVSDESLGVPEADLVDGVLRWSHQKCIDLELVPNLENKRSVLQQDTVNKLRFLALSREHFVSNVAFNKTKGDESILTLEESYAILMNMVQPNSYPLPEGFSTATKQRTLMAVERVVRRIFNPLGTYTPPHSTRVDKLTVMSGPTMYAPYGCKSFSLDLVVSRNIALFGIQVPTFIPSMAMPITPKVYEETYIVSIQNASKPNKPMIGSINWTGKVAYGSSVDLLFKESVRLEKNNTYTIMVYTNNTYYVNQKLCTVEDTNGIKFTLKDCVSLYGKPGKQDFGFISQIIYSL